ncbi:DegT/DnrJ/EryC1/StrS aminotransferase [Desulfarculus baarsii DSM 2075]|uniref:DegT/DnrJ/EryC1/StrS aminotransferase n=1 Tax=Desulfarculus baarsii (strain ATCC 33931 / DSM 2075 / LMG 7858 / VKM B-1802 / 2st14) TaxID=644282 RepID=E1QDU3_DESB2|nr:DegT/DnrJ/EryC1/StrS family aminotransferase [Desulfarculus baarsii]ADK83729.1 DegT/DnrJ/EryC1/StrS aminotransferase [Desulfarculus baarsii DSM 2075]
MLLNDLTAKANKYQSLISAAMQRVLASGWFVLGPEVARFEQDFAAYLGLDHCAGLANGTDAIELALKAMGVGPGDAVATVANAGMYTTTAVLASGAEPYFMDVDQKSMAATLEQVRLAVEHGVKVVVVTHLYGLIIPQIASIADFCAQHGVPLLEDCAQIHGARLDGKAAGSFGDAACFSFYPTKNLGALGDGGVVATNNADLAARVKLLRQYGWTSKYRAEVPGARNSRLDELQAAILSALLPELDAANARRREVAARLSRGIAHPEVVTPPEGGPEYVAHLYVVRCPRREALRQHLRANGIASEVHYPIADHRQPLFGERFAHVRLATTERLVDEILTLPCYPEMSDAQADQVIAVVNNWSI